MVMIEKSRGTWPFLFLLAGVLLLPWAHVKTTLFGLPVYIPEWAVVAAIGAATGFLRGSVRLDRTVVFGLVLFVAGAGLSFLINPFSLTGLGLLKSWFVFPALFGLLLWWTLKTREEWELLLRVWLGMLVAVSAYSLSFFFSGDLTYDGRLTGIYSSPNFLAFFVAPAPLIIGYLFLTLPREKWVSGYSFFLTGGLAVSLPVLFLTRSYGTWLALFAAFSIFCGGLFLNKTWARKYHLVVLAIPLLVIVSFVSFDWQSEKWQALLHQDTRSSLASRMMIWQAAGAILRDNPLFGIGVGRFQVVYLEYQRFFPPYLEWAVPEPHNFFLALFLSGGLLGTIGFFVCMGRLLVLIGRTFFQSEKEWYYSALLLLSLWTLFFGYGLLDTPYFKTDLAYVFFLVLALSLRASERVGKKENTPERGC